MSFFKEFKFVFLAGLLCALPSITVSQEGAPSEVTLF